VPAHLKRRNSNWYIIDGNLRKSLKTAKKGLATYLLDQYNKGKYGLGPKLSVKQWYERWIETKLAPLVRSGTIGDYKQHWNAYISALSPMLLSNVDVDVLEKFRERLLAQGLSVKTARNIVDGTFRAMWRDAMKKGLVDKNPFALLDWPRQPRHRPDPFTVEERDRIIKWWADNDFFFFPYVFFQFHTGCRPSETAGLTWKDVDLEVGTITINRSLVQGEEDATKTEGADRIIKTDQPVLDVVRLLPSRELGLPEVFVGKRGNPMSKKWAEHNWAPCLKKLEIRHRKFYATRHTFITEMVKQCKNMQEMKGLADFCGTSLSMIEKDYCARQGFSLDRTEIAQPKITTEDVKENLVAGPGFEPGTSRL
jgi:integrase